MLSNVETIPAQELSDDMIIYECHLQDAILLLGGLNLAGGLLFGSSQDSRSGLLHDKKLQFAQNLPAVPKLGRT